MCNYDLGIISKKESIPLSYENCTKGYKEDTRRIKVREEEKEEKREKRERGGGGERASE